MLLRAAAASPSRRGAPVVEFAFVTPFLAFLFVIAIDYARVFYCGAILQNCARNGAYYASDYPNAMYVYNDIYGYKSLDDAVLKDAGNLVNASHPERNPKYTVGYSYTVDGTYGGTPLTSGYVKVTVTWQFRTITQFPGVPGTVDLSRSVIMKMAPAQPQF
jgi:Flp pilus assembly protein TadG